jgi:predicted Zn-ribbon and HTH transcriptional regulator
MVKYMGDNKMTIVKCRGCGRHFKVRVYSFQQYCPLCKSEVKDV